MKQRLDEEFREFMHGRWPAMVRLAYAQVLLGSASAAAVRIVATQDGHTITARPQTIAGQRFFALATGSDMNLLHWTAYDAAGHRVAAGQY